MVEDVGLDEVDRIVERVIEIYREREKRGQRLGDFIESVGFENFKSEVLKNL